MTVTKDDIYALWALYVFEMRCSTSADRARMPQGETPLRKLIGSLNALLGAQSWKWERSKTLRVLGWTFEEPEGLWK